ncbi:reverse transcriptase domain-containing protein, partial [Tanacetum coccineum]
MIKITTAFLRGEVAAGNQERKKTLPPWNQQDAGHTQNLKKGGFKNQQRPERRQDRFTLLSKTPKEILALEKGKFKTPPPMTTPVEKRNNNKFCEFHGEPWQRVARQRVTQSFSPDQEISFPPIDEEEGVEGPMIIEAEVGGHFIHRMYVDGGSASEILYEHCFNKLLPEVKSKIVPATTPLIGFSGEIIWPLGQISLHVKIRDEEHSTSAWMNFVVVRSASPYNRIIKRPWIKKVQAVSSTAHEMIAFCDQASSRRKNQGGNNPEYLEQTIMIGSTLTEVGRGKLCDLLRRNLGMFAWKPADMTVMVKKHDGSWRMCVDFKDLNKACPKEGYRLPEIDWKVESLYGFPFKCFLDAYKGYHQIKMAKEDEEKTTFITSQGIYCYSKMPFGLRNARETYQRLVDKAFHKQVGRNLEVYVDDLVIKIRTEIFPRSMAKMCRTTSSKLCPRKVKFLIVAIDYFTKWIEAKAVATVATITGNQVKKFVWDNIVCRFGLPGEIVSDNGKQFR